MALLEKHLYIKKSTLPGTGKGLFTKKNIVKGTRIVQYKGRVMTWKEAKKLPDSNNGYLFYINSKNCINAWGHKKAFARYANDAKGIVKVKGVRTNAEYVIEEGRCYVEAIRDIPRYGEIFVEYGKEYWQVTRENLRIDQREQKQREQKKKRRKKKKTTKRRQ